MSTKRTISEAIQRRLNGGDPAVGSRVHKLEIDAAVMQALNALLRPQHFETLQSGGNEAEGFILCTYDSVPVVAYKGVSKTVLPAIPANLIKNLGVHRVYNGNDINDGAFIPCSAAEMEMIASQRLMNDILPVFAYKVRGKDLIYNKDLTAQSPAVTTVSIELVVMDYSKFTEWDILPINADMEAQVIDIVVKQFLGTEQVANQVNDPSNDNK
jgi:hypothetical protein